MLKHESCQLGGFGGDALVESLRYCFNPHFNSGSEGQSKVSDCQEFPVSSQVTGGADRGILPIKISRLSKKKKKQRISSFEERLPLDITFVISTLANHLMGDF